MTTLTNIAAIGSLKTAQPKDTKKGGPTAPLLLKLNRQTSVGGATIVGCSGHTIAGTFTTAIVAQLALLELARVGAVALLLLFFQIPALGHPVLSV